MSPDEVVKSVNDNNYNCDRPGCRVVRIRLDYVSESWTSYMECAGGYAFNGVSTDAEGAMIRMRINYLEFHEKNCKPKIKGS